MHSVLSVLFNLCLKREPIVSLPRSTLLFDLVPAELCAAASSSAVGPLSVDDKEALSDQWSFLQYVSCTFQPIFFSYSS